MYRQAEDSHNTEVWEQCRYKYHTKSKGKKACQKDKQFSITMDNSTLKKTHLMEQQVCMRHN